MDSGVSHSIYLVRGVALKLLGTNMENIIRGRKITLRVADDGRRIITDTASGIRAIAYSVCRDSDESLMDLVAFRALMLT
jgi:hypothetical protein